MPKSTKPEAPKFLSWDDADGAGLEALKCQAEIDKAKAALNAAVAAAKEKHKQAIQEPTLQKGLILEGVEKFVSAHRGELVGRSRTLTHIVVGYRKRPPAVVKLLDTWDDVLARLQGLGTKAKAFLATKQDVDKNAIRKAWAENKLSTDQLSELGVAIDDQSEDFFCEAIAQTVAEPG
ncbi:MAG TPA: host-nuclease inhibitor Gam family protein [Armatimonadota bacterium]|nr:host-nuclease inhibitor Gam family protein [Armatimonadota bacterium]